MPLLCSSVLSAPALQNLKKPVLIDSETGLEMLPTDSLYTSAMPGQVRTFLTFSSDHSALRQVTVSLETAEGQRSCCFHTLPEQLLQAQARVQLL